jgi:hypothetical protein
MATPIDIIPQLEHAILTRRGVRCYYAKLETPENGKSLFAERARMLAREIDTDA